MGYFEWKPEIVLGHAQIDQEHKQMLLLAEAIVEPLLDSASHQPNVEPMQALIAFSRKHFAHEEELMRAAAYPGTEEHAKYHASLLTELESYCAKVASGANTNAVGLIAFLWNWLALHIQNADRKLVEWLASH